MKKQFISGIMITLLTCIVFIGSLGCSIGDSKIIIKVGFLPDIVASPVEWAYYEECIERFEHDFPEYQIEATPYTYSSDTVVAKALTGQLPTVFLANASEVEWLAEGKYISSLGNIPDKLGWTEKADKISLSLLTKNDELYGLPRSSKGYGIIINLKQLYEMGLTVKDESGYLPVNKDGVCVLPKTFDELEQLAEQVYSYYGGKVSPIFMPSDNEQGGRLFENIAYNFGATAFQSVVGGKWTSNMDGGECVNAMRWIQNMSSKQLLYRSTAYLSQSELYKLFSENKVTMAFCGSDDAETLMSVYGVSSGEIAFIPIPVQDSTYEQKVVCDPLSYLFSSRATYDEIYGAVNFLLYMGRAPVMTEEGRNGLENRFKYASDDAYVGALEVPVWTNEEYVQEFNTLKEKYYPNEVERFESFTDCMMSSAVLGVKYYTSAVYSAIDDIIQRLLKNPNAYNVYTLLSSANITVQENYLDQLNSNDKNFKQV